MSRKRYEWKLRSSTLLLGERTVIVGVLNVTPDSLADEGRYQDPERALARAFELVEQGAGIVEIGAESIRPDSERVSEAEELRRLVPVLKRLRGALSVPLCVETAKSAVAEKALEYGVEIVKDPSGCIWDPALAKVVAKYNAGLVIQHMRGTPQTWAKLPGLKNPAGSIVTEIKASISRAARAGVLPQRIVVDPGLGMGKRKEHNTELIRQIETLIETTLPIQISPTGKQFVTTPPLGPSNSMASAAAVAAILRGVPLVRIHDIPEIRPAILTADEMLLVQGAPAPERGEKKDKDRPGADAPRRSVRAPLKPRS